VSYHETYEFFAIDRRLTPAEMRALRAISTRATITPTRFYNFYDWGGLKADPHDLVRRYFDLFVYTEVNSGTRWGILRFPAGRIDTRLWRPYVTEQRGSGPPSRSVSMATRGEAVLLTLYSPEGEGDEFDDEGFDEGGLAVPLALVRADLLAGDLRALYLLWLSAVQCGERRSTAAEPARPPGRERVSRMPGVLASLAEFVGLDDDLLAVALEPSRSARSTAGALLSAARSRRDERRRRAAERAAAERARRLALLEKRQEQEWTEVARLVGEKKARAYDDAVKRLRALRELSMERGSEAVFAARLAALLEEHRSKHAFRDRVAKAGLSLTLYR
jgi:hypothetical protein